MKKLHDFIAQVRPFIKPSAVEAKAGVPRNCLTKHYHFVDGKKHGQKLNWSNTAKIIKALAEIFGQIEIDGWRIVTNTQSPAIVAIRPIVSSSSAGRAEEEETILEKDGNFIYMHPEYRVLYDDFDFSTYF
jgi:hypothetical protein